MQSGRTTTIDARTKLVAVLYAIGSLAMVLVAILSSIAELMFGATSLISKSLSLSLILQGYLWVPFSICVIVNFLRAKISITAPLSWLLFLSILYESIILLVFVAQRIMHKICMLPCLLILAFVIYWVRINWRLFRQSSKNEIFRESNESDFSSAIYYAGFWRRSIALLIDTWLIAVVGFLLLTMVWMGTGGIKAATINPSNIFEVFKALSFVSAFYTTLGIAFLPMLLPFALGLGHPVFYGSGQSLWYTWFATACISWLYYALMESSSAQATFGKRAMGIVVTDTNGRHISFRQATFRYFAKISSMTIFFLGYLMVPFTPKKQALHDVISGCLLVVNAKNLREINSVKIIPP